MLTEKEILENKKEFLSLIKSISRKNADLAGLVDWLENRSDFFTAPASTKYHCGYAGGLCEHSLNVYKTLVKLVEDFASHFESHESEDKTSADELCIKNYSDDSIKIVALLHDISKANFYEEYARNVKNEEGQWIQVKEYRTRDVHNRFIYGNHEQTSEFMVRTFIPLELEESVAILNHHGGMGFDSSQVDLTPIYNKYNLSCLLHLADMLSTYIIEKL